MRITCSGVLAVTSWWTKLYKDLQFICVTFSILLCSPAPCKKYKNILGSENIIWTRLLVFPKNKIRTKSIWIFCVFLWCQGSLLTVIQPPDKLQCNCRGRMNGQQWPWHHKHLKTTYKTNFFWRKCEKGGEVKNKENCWISEPFYSLKSVIGHKYNQLKRVPQPKPSKNALKLH